MADSEKSGERSMGKAMSGLTMSLDGFIAAPDSPGYSQRFTGTFGEDGSAITGF
jgi:hypothetical protein